MSSANDGGSACAAIPERTDIVTLTKTLSPTWRQRAAPDKIEGIALVGPRRLAIANDNDFGMTDGATWDPLTGELTNDTGLPSQIVFVAV